MTDQTTPPPVGKIFGAILAVKRHLAETGVGKNQKNAQQGYSFRGIDDIMNAMAAPLVNAGITVVPNVLSRTQDIFVTDSKKRVTSVSLDTEFRFVADDGSYLTARIQSEASDYADKATNKAISFALKYAFISVFNIPVVGADDGDFESPGNDAAESVAAAPQTVAAKPQAAAKTTKAKATKAAPAEKVAVEQNAITKLLLTIDPATASRVAALIRKAYNVGTVNDVPADKIKEATGRIELYLKNAASASAAPKAAADTANDIPE